MEKPGMSNIFSAPPPLMHKGGCRKNICQVENFSPESLLFNIEGIKGSVEEKRQIEIHPYATIWAAPHEILMHVSYF